MLQTRVNQGSGSPAISISSTSTTGAATGVTEFKVGDIVQYEALTVIVFMAVHYKV